MSETAGRQGKAATETPYYSARELAGQPEMPGTERGVHKRASRDGWDYILEDAKGGPGGKIRKYPLTAFPRETQIALLLDRRAQKTDVLMAEVKSLLRRALELEKEIGKHHAQEGKNDLGTGIVAGYYSARELSGLPGMPGTVKGVIGRAKREGWNCRKRKGRGGGREYLVFTYKCFGVCGGRP